MTWVLILGVGLALLVFAGSRLHGRAHTVVVFTASSIELRRGKLPPGLLGELQDLRLPEGARDGQLEVLGQADTLELRTPGLSDDFAQRVRNVTLLRRNQLRRP